MVSPIFLISQPRAGSTLVQRYIALSPHVSTLTEPWIAFDPLRALKKDAILSCYGGNTSINAASSLHELFGSNQSHVEAARSYLSILYNKFSGEGSSYFLDKTPRYYYYVTELVKLFPDSTFIILYRNPLSVLSSFINSWGKGSFCHFHAYIDDLLLAPRLLVDAQQIYCKNMHFINYEKFVQDPTLLDHALPFNHSSTSKNIQDGKPLKGGLLGDEYLSYRPIDTSSVDSWKKSINSPVKLIVYKVYLNLLGSQLLTSMGYSFKELHENCRISSFNFPALIFNSLKDLYYLFSSTFVFIFQPNIFKIRLQLKRSAHRYGILPYLQ